MKAIVKEILKEHGRLDDFSESRYDIAVSVMHSERKKDPQLNKFLGIAPYYRAKYVADALMLNQIKK